jgi:translation initiation factor 1 (eIF-1/SUI1)
MEDRKILLKEMKRSFGVGGTLVDGVLEIQGAYAVRALGLLQKKGYEKAKKIG